MDDITVYTCKDGRTRAYIKITKKVVSYPRLILEEKLGRPLDKYEQVHHIDGDPLNNDPSNLEVLKLGEHQKHHNPVKYKDKMVRCFWCGKEFMWTGLQQRKHHGNHNKRNEELDTEKPFCSKRCIGLYGKHIQLQYAGVAE